jgi:hypothetical protein
MPVVHGSRLGDQPGLVKHRNHLLRQGPLLQIPEVALQLGEIADTDDDAVVPAILDVERGVMHHPAQCRLEQRQPVFLHHRLNQLQRLKRRVLKVPVPVVGARVALFAEAAFRRDDVLGFVFAGKDSASERVVDDDFQAVSSTSGDELRLDRSC